MAKFKPYNYEQTVMISITLNDQPEPGTLEYAIHKLVEDKIGLSIFEKRYQNDDTLNAFGAFNPQTLLKNVLFAYSRVLIGSRPILQNILLNCHRQL